MTFRAIDLFCGCGGLSLGLIEAGFDVALALDKWPQAVASYNLNIPGEHAQVADVADFDFTSYAGKIDLIAGGPPCQGHSRLIAGKKNTERLSEKNEQRNALALDFVRAIEVVQPKAVLMENVRGFAKHPVWQEVYSRLRAAGYAINADVIDMSYYGLMQKRERFIMLAVKGQRLPYFPQKQPPPRNCRPAFENLLQGPMQDVCYRPEGEMLENIKTVPSCGLQSFQKGRRAFKDVYGRINWNSLAPTINGGCLDPGRGRFLHPVGHRGISAREALRLQGFPDAYALPRFSVRDMAQLIGNAFPPVVAEFFGKWLKRHIAMARDEPTPVP